MTKQFTVDEANRTLPLVRRIVTDIVATHRELVELIKEYGHIDPDLESLHLRRRELEEEMGNLTERVNHHLEELEAVGAVFKGFEQGLVDFHGLLDGRPVLWCWKLGERQIEWWHEVEAGYAGRQRLPEHLLSYAIEASDAEPDEPEGEAGVEPAGAEDTPPGDEDEE